MTKTIRVLHVDDDQADAEIVRRLLGKSPHAKFELTWCDTLEKGVAAAATSGFNVILLDRGLPGVADLDGLIALRAADQRIPIILVTDFNDEATALRALDQGAQDYLLKGNLTTDNLIRAVQHSVQRQSLLLSLSAARDLLEKKNRRLAKLFRMAHRFVDNVSHEFRTPLTVIKEYVSLIGEGVVGDVSDEQRRMLSVVELRADDLNTMVDDMLDSSKLEAGLLAVHRNVCTPQDIVERVWPGLERKAIVKGISLELEIDEAVDAVFCDSQKAGRVLINLIANAINFCGAGGKVILTVEKDKDSPSIRFSVIDNGPGISPENQEAIFRRFKQVGVSTRGSTKGFGLGLAIAKELVGINLGEMNLVSRLGQGSTFSFTMPPADPAVVMERYLDRAERLRGAHVVLLTAEVSETEPERVAEDTGEFLSYVLRSNDLIFRVGKCRWLIVLATSDCEITKFRERLDKEWADANRNRLCEPIPDIELGLLGSWRVRGSRSDLLAALKMHLEPREVGYV